MLQSMTGFGSKEADIKGVGKISVELKSSNHKFLDISFHLPDGFLSMEDRIKQEIAPRIKRGRLTCAINLSAKKAGDVFVNQELLKKYVSALKKAKSQHRLKDDLCLSTVMHLPGILSLEEGRVSKSVLWPKLKTLIDRALDELVKTRNKEGRALEVYLRKRAEALHSELAAIKSRFKKAVQKKLPGFSTDEERSSFLKSSDINEEIERLDFHIKNFKNRLAKSGPVGKELDFIAQEMQREANTIAAKSFDVTISAKVVQIKSMVEKIREQVQNIE